MSREVLHIPATPGERERWCRKQEALRSAWALKLEGLREVGCAGVRDMGCECVPSAPDYLSMSPVRNEDRERAWRASRETKLETIPNCEAW